MAHSQGSPGSIFQTRAYQLEMFHYSLEANTIVVMGTGTGKTHIASLRIDAELTRNPSKLVWFTAPNAGLVDQQRQFLASQLPEYNVKSLTGRDNVDLWKARTWKTVLEDVNIVVATPQILFDALHNAHVQLKRISLLIFDEAHHCQANSPSAKIMRNFYHPQKSSTGTQDLPHILGLTASPLISERSASVVQLEQNLDAVCRSPTISIDQYVHQLQKPVLVKRLFNPVPKACSELLQLLRHIVRATTMSDDPYYGELQLKALKDGNDGERARQKLRKYERSGQTPAIADISKLLGNAEHLHDSLGTWASDLYITTCVSKWQSNALEVNEYHESHTSRYRAFVNDLTCPLHVIGGDLNEPHKELISAKALSLVDFLISAYHVDLAIIVFVERRAAAWALCQLLQAMPMLTCYGIFSYVGSSSGKVTALHEGYATKKQDMEFMGFRQGLRNLCIATSVAEEGIDVQAVNVVVRFDDPKQLVSYVQSRGRARCKDSKIVYFQDTNGPPGRYDHWVVFEKELEQLYYQQERERQRRQVYEKIIEDSSESYLIESTGARLDLNVSISRLAHFCAKQPIPSDPVYILDGKPGIAISAKVLLPSTVPPPLREALSCRMWRSENMAKRDAAFHAMEALHIAGLINDHLVPFEADDTSEILFHEQRMRQVPPEQQVWPDCREEMRPFRIEVKHEQTRYLSLILILQSASLQLALCFPLTESSGRNLNISIVPLSQDCVGEMSKVKDVTHFLFEAAFQPGSASTSLKDPCRLSCILVPEFNDTRLGQESERLEDFLRHYEWLRNLQPLLIWGKSRPRPYIWYPPHVTKQNIEGDTVLVAKQVRKLQIFARSLNTTPGKESLPADKELLIEECEARGIASVYGPAMLLVPTLLHYMAAATRAQHATQAVLSSIEFSDLDHVIPALIAKSASGMYNYERLEFLGDACLKYLTSVQMFFNQPLAPEGVLTNKTHQIIGNNRLEKATLDIGLAPFITTETPAQKHWKLPRVKDNLEMVEPRNILSKTLADVIESVLGAAFLDGAKTGHAIARCIEALQLFIPEVPWQAPEDHIKAVPKHSREDNDPSLLQQRIRDMTGCDIENPQLLAEALTHSTDVATQQALDRLEFLGDAILDQIVKIKLYHYKSLDAGRLTVCRHALVSHAFLAHLAFGVHCKQVVKTVHADKAGDPYLIRSTKQINLTDLIKFREASMREPIAASKTKFEDTREHIESELKEGRFPWTLLRGLNAPKVCSDVIESLLAALYLDADGSLAPCERLLDRLGLMKVLEQMAMNTDFEVRTPGTILRELCEEHKIAVSIKARCEQSQEARHYVGEIRLGGIEGEISITRIASCLEEAKSVAAEAARHFLLLLRQSNNVQHDSGDFRMDIDTEVDIDAVMS